MKALRIALTCWLVGSHESRESTSLRRKRLREFEGLLLLLFLFWRGLDLELLGLTQILGLDKDEEFVTGL